MRAPAIVGATALLNGRTLLIRDGAIYSRFFLAVTTVAMDFLELEREFRRIRARSASLSEIDRSRLHRILEFIREELEDQPQFEQLSLRQYETDRAMRRNLDRWVEMLINAAIDAAKIVLAAERRRVSQTYGQMLELIDTVPGFTDIGERLKPPAALRNIPAHEYLDLRFVRLQSFVQQDIQAVRDQAEAGVPAAKGAGPSGRHGTGGRLRRRLCSASRQVSLTVVSLPRGELSRLVGHVAARAVCVGHDRLPHGE